MTPAEIAALPYRPCVGVMLVNAEGSACERSILSNGNFLRVANL